MVPDLTHVVLLDASRLGPEDLEALGALAGTLRQPEVRSRLERECVLPYAIDWLVTTTSELLESGRLPLWVGGAYAEIFLGTLGATLDRLELWGHPVAAWRDHLTRLGRSWHRSIEDAAARRAKASRVSPAPAR